MRQETVRLFTALEIPESLRSDLADVPGSLKTQLAGARWVPARSMHITLHFIGNVPRESLPELRRALSGVFPASGTGPFSLSLTAPGFFLRQGRASLWAGVTLSEELSALHCAEGGILRRVCGLKEKGAYSPHVTLARVCGASRTSLENLLHENASPAWAGKSFPVSSSVLVKSDLTPAGAVYHTIERYFPRERA